MNQELKTAILKKLNEDVISTNIDNSSLSPNTVINPQLVGIFVEREVNKLLKQNAGKLIPQYLHSANQKLKRSGNALNNHSQIEAHISSDSNQKDASTINSYDFVFKIENGKDKKDWIYIFIDAKASRQNNVIFQRKQIDVINNHLNNSNAYFYILYYAWNYTNKKNSESKENKENNIELKWNPEKGVASCCFDIKEIHLIDLKKLVKNNPNLIKKRGRISGFDDNGDPIKAEYSVTSTNLKKYAISKVNLNQLNINPKTPDEYKEQIINLIRGITKISTTTTKKTVTLNITEESLKSLQESYGSNLSLGYGTNYSSSANQPYFQYDILPLNNNLGQKGYKIYSRSELQTFDIMPGHYVSGISPIDEKKHYGIILRFFRPETQLEWEWVFILDKNSAEVMALYPDTIKKEFRTGKSKK